MSRLLVFTENYRRGGGNRYMIDTINGVAALFDEIVIASNHAGLFAEDLERLQPAHHVEEIPVLTVGGLFEHTDRTQPFARLLLLSLARLAEPLLFARNLWLCRRLLRRVRPTLVLACNGGYPAARATLAMTIAARREGVSAVHSVVGAPTPKRRAIEAYEAWIDRRVWRSCETVIVNSRAIEAALERLHEMPPGLARLAHNGIEHDGVAPRERGDGLVVGCVARLDREKGVLDLLEAFAQLAPRWTSARLVLVGHGDASAEVARRVTELGLEDRVTLAGHFDGPVEDVLADFDVYAFASWHEGFPYSILEAMRAGLPIVSTNVGGIPEAVEDGRDGLLVPPQRPQEFTDALARVLENAELRRALGGSARARFEREFTLEAMHARDLEIFSELLERVSG